MKNNKLHIGEYAYEKYVYLKDSDGKLSLQTSGLEGVIKHISKDKNSGEELVEFDLKCKDRFALSRYVTHCVEDQGVQEFTLPPKSEKLMSDNKEQVKRVRINKAKNSVEVTFEKKQNKLLLSNPPQEPKVESWIMTYKLTDNAIIEIIEAPTDFTSEADD